MTESFISQGRKKTQTEAKTPEATATASGSVSGMQLLVEAEDALKRILQSDSLKPYLNGWMWRQPAENKCDLMALRIRLMKFIAENQGG